MTALFRMSGIVEPLEVLARFSRLNADRLCPPEVGCRDYHRSWSTVRLIETGGRLPAGIEHFAPALQSMKERRGPIRVLLSGAADTGLAAMVLEALHGDVAFVEIVLADRCATTIEQNALFAGAVGLRFEPHLTDLAELDCAPVDVVIAHNFIQFLPVAKRADLVKNWARLLGPQGQMLIYQGLLSEAEAGVQAPVTALDVAERADLLARKARARGFPEAEIAAVVAEALAFWQFRATVGAVRLSDLRGWIDDAGFCIRSMAPIARSPFQSPYGGNRSSAGHQTFLVTAERA